MSRTGQRHNSTKRRKYIEFRLAGHKPVDAARFAGYSSPETTGYDVDKHPEVQAALAQQREALIEKSLYSREEAIEDLKEGIRMAKTGYDAQALRACVQELNKIFGYHAPEKKQVDVNQNVNGNVTTTHTLQQLESLPDKALLEAIGGAGGLIIEGEFSVVKEEDDDVKPTDLQ